MRITPLDVRKQEFRKSVRGFDCDEVRAFLTTLADEYETVLIDNKQIRERVMDQDEKISEYQTMERTLRDTLMTAERLMQETRENANREGELIVQESQLKAREVLQECRIRTEELRREIVGLRKEKETYLARYKNLAQAQIEFVESHQNDFEDLDKRLINMVDSVVADAETKLAASGPQATTETSGTMSSELSATTPTTSYETPAVPVSQPARDTSRDVDVWRDYQPDSDQQVEKAVETLVATAEAVSNIETEKTISEAATVSAASVDMAAMGIPVPAVTAGRETSNNS